MVKHIVTFSAGVCAGEWYAQNRPLALPTGDVSCRGGPRDFIDS